MAAGKTKVEEALDRWVRRGLLEEDTAERLREDARRSAAAQRRRIARGAMAVTAAVILICAGVLFFAEVWEALGAAVQSIVIASSGVLLFVGGFLYEGRARDDAESGSGPVAVAYGLQAAGLGVLATAAAHSDAAWPSGLPSGRLVAILTFMTPVGAFALVRTRNRVMPALVVLGAYVFFAVGLHRFSTEPSDAGIWILDGIFVLLTVGMAGVIRGRAARGASTEAGLDALLVAFAAHLYVGFALLLATGLGPLSLEGDAYLLVDAWWVLVTAAIAWGVHGAPGALRRPWIPRLLPLSVALAVILAFPTVLAGLNGDATGAAVMVAVVGAAALGYGLRWEIPGVVEVGCLALIVAAWTYTASRSSPLAGALALAGTAAVLFWLARRSGAQSPHPDPAAGR